MARCYWCECSPCFLDCERRHRQPTTKPWRESWKHGVGREASKEERTALLKLARSLLGSGVAQAQVAERTGLRRDYVSTIAHRLRHGITGGRKRAA